MAASHFLITFLKRACQSQILGLVTIGGPAAPKPSCFQSHIFRTTITDLQDEYCGDCYDIYIIQSQYTKVAAFGHHHKRGDAAFGRATSFVVSFVFILRGARSYFTLASTFILILRGAPRRNEKRPFIKSQK